MNDVEIEKALKAFVIKLAREESSIFDILCEARQVFMKDKSFNAMNEINSTTLRVVEALFRSKEIGFYNKDNRNNVDLQDAISNIYETFTYTKNHGG